MESIEKYVKKFLNNHEKNVRYDMNLHEIFLLEEFANKNKIAAFTTTFDYGYAKGYRAALAEMKKGGAVSCR